MTSDLDADFELEFDDGDLSGDYRTCPACGGTGGVPMNDYILPCEYCDGEGYLWWE